MRRFPFVFLIISIFFVWIAIQFLISLYPNFLWFDNLGFASVFWTNLWARVLTGIAFALLFFVVAGINVFIARWLSRGKIVERRGRRPEANIKKSLVGSALLS